MLRELAVVVLLLWELWELRVEPARLQKGQTTRKETEHGWLVRVKVIPSEAAGGSATAKVPRA